MDNLHLIDSIFEADYILFTNDFNEIKVFEGYFYIISMYEFTYNKEIVLLCECINNLNCNLPSVNCNLPSVNCNLPSVNCNDKLFLNYKDFNHYLIHDRIFYYSNVNRITQDDFLYKEIEEIKNCKRIKRT